MSRKKNTDTHKHTHRHAHTRVHSSPAKPACRGWRGGGRKGMAEQSDRLRVCVCVCRAFASVHVCVRERMRECVRTVNKPKSTACRFD